MSIDLCLVSPPQRAYNHYRPPLSLMLIASFLEKNGIETEIIDPKSSEPVLEHNKDIIVNEIMLHVERLDPKIVGISCYTPEFEDVMQIAYKIKVRNNSTKVIVGGIHPTLSFKDFFFENSPVDYVVIGEGELTVYELIRAILEKNKRFNDIFGIVYYDQIENRIIQTPPRPLINDLDKMPFPAYKKVDMEYYTSPNPYAIRGLFLSSFYILTGRGCPMQCTFCVSAELSKSQRLKKSLRCRSGSSVVDEIELLKKEYLIDSFYFIDDNFSLYKDLAFEICDSLIKRKINLLWGCSARINNLSEELLKKMKKSGCTQIDLGVESGSDAVLKRLKKGITIKQTKEVFKNCHKIGIRTFANVLINVPNETERELDDTLKLLDEIKPSVTSFNIFIPYLGTEIYNSQNVNLNPDEYKLLGESPRKLILNPKFRFTKHNIDLNKFYITNHRKYNSFLNFLPDYLAISYIRQLIKSRRKKDYFLKSVELFKEFLKQVMY